MYNPNWNFLKKNLDFIHNIKAFGAQLPSHATILLNFYNSGNSSNPNPVKYVNVMLDDEKKRVRSYKLLPNFR